MIRALRNLWARTDGSIAIETAIVAPILASMALGTYEIGTMVSRQHELQTAASEGETIALAAAAGATTNIATIKAILKTSIGLSDNQIAVTRFYRCNANTATTTNVTDCDDDDVVSSYIKIDLTDTYTPVWTDFGVGSPITLDVERTVQLS